MDDLYNKILNISNNDITNIIEDAVKMARDTIPIPDRMCILASNLIYNYLKDRHILCKIINTKELGMGYRHDFVLAKDTNNTYLIDTTYSQFKDNGFLLDEDILVKGYTIVNDDILFNYLNTLPTPYGIDSVNVENLFLSPSKRK